MCSRGTLHPHPIGSHRAPTTPPAAAAEGAATASPAAPPRRQLITVTTAAYGQTYATLGAYQAASHGWRRVSGPWTGRIGRDGFA
jgi:hypothetical protein